MADSPSGRLDQNDCPILDGLADYHQADRLGFTPPGHKQLRGVDPRVLDIVGPDVFRADVLATSGLDDRTTSHGYLQQAERLMAEAVGAKQAFFSTCGSSLSVKSALIAVAAPGDSLLIGRDAHKSVVSGFVLAGVEPVWLAPVYDRGLHLAHPPSPEAVERAWEKHPDAAGLLITSPTPYGTCADLAKIVQLCHARGKPVIVDEAWGAHLPFHDRLPTWAMDAGADVCVVSIHKMGGGLEQGSVFHLQGDLVDPARLMECSDLLSTTSPNVLLYAAMDGWRRQMVQHGHDLLESALELATSARERIERLPGLHVLEKEFLAVEASSELDPLQTVVDLQDLGIAGYDAADWLREQERIDVGLSDHRRIGIQFSYADTPETAERLLLALAHLVEAAPGLPKAPRVDLPDPAAFDVEPAMLPREAFFAAAEMVPAGEAEGRVAVEQVTPYPPGIPALLPGERISAEILHYLRTGVDAGMVVPDAADPTLRTLKVVR
jgi:arginine/lysine/ornithine decarboxylase